MSTTVVFVFVCCLFFLTCSPCTPLASGIERLLPRAWCPGSSQCREQFSCSSVSSSPAITWAAVLCQPAIYRESLNESLWAVLGVLWVCTCLQVKVLHSASFLLSSFAEDLSGFAGSGELSGDQWVCERRAWRLLGAGHCPAGVREQRSLRVVLGLSAEGDGCEAM